MKILNIGVLAHVDAGKTTLTEQILYKSGVIEHAGSVDQGTTITDSLDVERRRGITVKSAAVSFTVNELKVNLIDTPGHADFISEVEHSLSVLDGVILVISAVEGVQAQTRILMQTLKEHRIPTLLFMNKVDRMGADYKQTRDMIKELLDERICEMNEVIHEGHSNVQIEQANPAKAAWIDTLALTNEDLFNIFANDLPIKSERLRAELRLQTKNGNVFPLFAGSAVKGIGVSQLIESLGDFFPVHTQKEEMTKPLSAIVFKVMKDLDGRRNAFIRLFQGSIQLRDEIELSSQSRETIFYKVKQLQILQDGKWMFTDYVAQGDIAILTGGDVKIGDIFGNVSDKMRRFNFHKPPMQVKVSVEYEKDEGALHNALSDLVIESPFLQYIQDKNTKESIIHVFGKIQLEILAETIKQQNDIDVIFSAPKVICIEKPFSTGEEVEYINDSNNPFIATVGLRVEPGVEGSGLQYRLDVELGSLLLSFQRAIKETVIYTLQEGLYGWNVTDIIVTLTHTGYDSVQTTAKDFRSLVPLVLMKALQEAGTNVYEPVHAMQLTLPEYSLSKVLSRLSLLEGTFQEPQYIRNSIHLNGSIPVRTSELLKSDIYSLTSGEGMVALRPGGYMLVQSNIPKNMRRQLNSLNRGEYLLHLNKIK
ncbi:elongation factor G [Bacillus horti]|uniref:Ribosomal protection tetracycline resistance protein n=1 Tax=Caldalkalibacillus horti TaxID=77523 RepID=A0ABT9VXV3_9BACI|nr:TetM/TetW/TetO/TetS family tetracycline resistance ribosomal protection protein [Bacillus horti]MDQ0165811.1 ribosomal protection tetracycline resistance protein [Bacillus horti]